MQSCEEEKPSEKKMLRRSILPLPYDDNRYYNTIQYKCMQCCSATTMLVLFLFMYRTLCTTKEKVGEGTCVCTNIYSIEMLVVVD